MAGITIGALLVGAFWSGSGRGTTALAAPSSINPKATSTRSTSFQIVNMGTAAATVVVKFFEQAGGTLLSGYQPSQTLAPGESMLKDQRFDTQLGSSFAGSAVGEASQKLGAIVNEFAVDGGTDGYNAIGSDEVGLVSVCPVAFGKVAGQGGKVYNTVIHVQGAGTSASTVTVQYINSSGSPVVPSNSANSSFTVNAGASKSLALENDANLAGFFGSVVITSSDQPIAAAAEQYTSAQLVDYTCFSAGAQTIYAPAAFRIDNFYRTSTIVANLGTTAATVTVNYTDAANSSFNLSFADTIPAKSSKIYDQGLGSTGQRLQNGSFGGLKITAASASTPLAVLVQEISNGDVQALAYRGIPDTALSKTVILPSIFSQIVDGTSGINFSTSFAVTNPSASTANLTMVFTPIGGGASVTTTSTIAAGQSKVYEQRPNLPSSTFASAGNFGSVKITSDQSVGAIVNAIIAQSQEADPDTATKYKDPVLGYNGIPG